MGPKVADLAYWIAERYSIKMRRDSGVPPVMKHGWSNDPLMGNVRYCNVHREDDKVTRWLAKHWRPKHHEVWEIVLARMVNYIPSLEPIKELGNWQLDVIKRVLKKRRDDGQKIWTSAYTISTNGVAMDKVDYVFDRVIAAAKRDWSGWDKSILPDLATSHAELMKINGLGSFLAAQVLADLKNTRGHPLQRAPDRYTWCAPGPGSLRGLEAFWGFPIPLRAFKVEIEQCWELVKPLVPDYVPRIDMQDFQNVMCEFSKYERFKAGGHVRNRYDARRTT